MKRTVIISFVTLATLALACSGSAPKSGATATKGGGSKTSSDAKSQNQKTGGTASSSKSTASKGESVRDGLTCDAESEGVAFCATDADLVFCSGGAWWALSCPALDSRAFCGIELSTATVDCWVP